VALVGDVDEAGLTGRQSLAPAPAARQDDPPMDRIDPTFDAPEFAMLTQFLDYHRATLVWKVSGLDKEQLATRVASSSLTLAGLVKHLAYVEDSWFQKDLLGRPLPEPWASAPFADDPDWEFHSAPDDDPDELLAVYAAACERSRAAVEEVGDLDAVAANVKPGDRVTLRWIILHMIEETARHNGHADLLREHIDGATGE
jgi:uncharacterized damage-inducible protein DinB